MQDLNNTPQPPDDDSPALADLLTPSDTPAQLLEVIEAPNTEKPKRKQKRRFYIANVGMYAGVAGVAAFTTLIVAGIVLLVATPRIVQQPQPSPTFPYPTPIPAYDPYQWDWNTPLMTTDYVGSMLPNMQVYITEMTFDLTQQVWLYTIRDPNGLTGTAYEWQIAPLLPPTPTIIPFAQAIGMGYLLITTEQVGAIPANTRVRIIQTDSDSSDRLYTIETETDHITVKAHSYQLTYAPDVTPGVTPTSPFMGIMNTGQFEVITLVEIGSLPPNTRVNVGNGHFNGHEWLYSIVTQDGFYVDNVPGSQLISAPLSPTDVPNPNIIPTSSFMGMINSAQFAVMTLAQIGAIPPEMRVNISNGQFNGHEWLYSIVTQNGLYADNVPESQLVIVPMVPTETPRP